MPADSSPHSTQDSALGIAGHMRHTQTGWSERELRLLAHAYIDLVEQLEAVQRQRDEIDADWKAMYQTKEDLREQLELLRGWIADEAEAGLPLPKPIRAIVEGSNPASRPCSQCAGAPSEVQAECSRCGGTGVDPDPASGAGTSSAEGTNEANAAGPRASSPASRLRDVAVSGTGASESFDDYDYRMAGVPDE